MTATVLAPTPHLPVRRRRLGSLDGLRAVAVAAVVVYHVDDRLLPGGFVGVDVFFALSGYLITALLLDERDRSGGVSLRDFWRRRIRRLWPLAWLVLALVAVAGLAGWWGADREATLPGETVAALANVANWWQAAHGGYVESFVAPSPLRHFWSLAVEEQFYLLWPILLVGLLALGRRWARRAGGDPTAAPAAAGPAGTGVVAAGTALLFAASAAAAWWSDPSTAYLATHTRAVGLLAGAGLALTLRRAPLAGPEGPRARRAVAVWAALGAAVLVAVALRATPEDPFLHRGGFSLVAVAATGVVALSLVPGQVHRALSWAPLVWAGRRSYAIYLVHWPVAVALGPEVPTAVALPVVVVTSVALAALLHVAVERPVLAGSWSPRLLGGAAAVVLAVTAGALALGRPEEPTPQERVAASLERVEDPTGGATAADRGVPEGADAVAALRREAEAPATTTTVPCVPTTVVGPQFGGTDQFDYATVGEVADPQSACDTQVRVLVLGDSLGRGAANGLVSLGDGRVQVWDRTVLGCSFGPERCDDWREAWAVNVLGIRPDVVLVFSRVLGDLDGVDDAGFLTPEAHAQRVATFTEGARLLGGTGARVLFVNAAVPGRPNGLYYCDGRATSSPCDPEWITAWNQSLADAAAAAGAGVVDAGGWTAARSATDRTDRPDGLHFSGGALREHAAWLLPQVLATVGRA